MVKAFFCTFSQNGRRFAYLCLWENWSLLWFYFKAVCKKFNPVNRILPLLFVLSSDYIVFSHLENLLNTFTLISLRSERKTPPFLGVELCGLSSVYTVAWLTSAGIQPASHSQVAMSVSKFLCQICGNFAYQLDKCGSTRTGSFITTPSLYNFWSTK